jgi:hypothetical protein
MWPASPLGLPDLQEELERRLAIKKRDGRVDRLVLVLSNTDWCRRLVREHERELETAFPLPGRIALSALAEGRDQAPMRSSWSEALASGR